MNVEVTKRDIKIIIIMAMFTVISFYAGRQVSNPDLSFDGIRGQSISTIVENDLPAVESSLNVDEQSGQHREAVDNLNNNEFSAQAESLSAGETGEVLQLNGDDAELMDTLVANPGSRPAAIASIIARQENLNAGETSTAAGNDAERLDMLLANPGSRSAAIAWTIAHQENLDARESSTAAGNDAERLDALMADSAERMDALMADPAARLRLIDWYASRIGVSQ